MWIVVLAHIFIYVWIDIINIDKLKVKPFINNYKNVKMFMNPFRIVKY